MSYLDIILSVPLMWGLYKGLSKGIIKELAALTALIAGIYGAIHLADNIHPYLKEQFAITSSFLPIVSFAITFIIIVLSIKLIGLIIDRVVKAVALGIISRLLGGIFGVFKTALILSALLLIINTIDYYLKLISVEQKKQSVLYEPISNIIPSIMPNVKDGDSLIKESEKILKDTEEKINLEL
tara:strand:- start:1518 stop:2066 length:549 start_codon:yes stop_codon:yes gene_type:complete